MANNLPFVIDYETIAKYSYYPDIPKIEIHFEAYYDKEQYRHYKEPIILVLEEWSWAGSKPYGDEEYIESINVETLKTIHEIKQDFWELTLTATTASKKKIQLCFVGPYLNFLRKDKEDIRIRLSEEYIISNIEGGRGGLILDLGYKIKDSNVIEIQGYTDFSVSLSRKIWHREIAEMKERFYQYIGNSTKLSKLFREKTLKFCLYVDYGMASAMLCYEMNGEMIYIAKYRE